MCHWCLWERVCGNWATEVSSLHNISEGGGLRGDAQLRNDARKRNQRLLALEEENVRHNGVCRCKSCLTSLASWKNTAASDFMLTAAPRFLVSDELLELFRHLADPKVDRPLRPLRIAAGCPSPIPDEKA